MEPEPAVLDSLRNAVQALPDDVPLRVHLATMLMDAGLRDEAVRRGGAILQRDPGNAAALALLQAPDPLQAPNPSQAASPPQTQNRPQTPDPLEAPSQDPASGPDQPAGFDWSQAESDVQGLLPPMFVGDNPAADEDDPAARAFDVEQSGLRLADVAGMAEVKKRLEAAFLAPMRNPELRRLYGKSLRGGLLLYGPPGCGKTFIARATAGELGAQFMAVSFADVIDMFVGQSERNIHELFSIARRHAPCVLFLDEVDALGQKRSQLRNTPMRSAVNQLLLEAVFRYHLRERPVGGVNLARLAEQTEGYSGADIAHVCETSAEHALMDSVQQGTPRLIGQADLEKAIGEVKPSLGPWFETARNVALFANEGGTYDDLAAYLKKRRML